MSRALERLESYYNRYNEYEESIKSGSLCETPLMLDYEDTKTILKQIDQLTNNWNELEEWLQNEYNEWSTVDDEIIRAEARQCIEVLDKMKEIKEND